MPHPSTSPHADHDRLLVAAYAAGDASGPDLETAQALVARCAGCSALHHELRAIAGAVGSLPAPVRTRDFRLTAAQAAALRPPAWRRLLEPFAGPRFAFAGPLGTGLATLGLAGLLVAGPLGMPMAGAGATSGERTGVATVEPGAPAAGPEGLDASPGVLGYKGVEQAPAPGDPAPGAGTQAPEDLGAVNVDAGPGDGSPLPVISWLAMAVGLLLAALRIASRRLGVPG